MSKEDARALAWKIKTEKEFRQMWGKITDKNDKWKKAKELGYDFSEEEYREALRFISQ